jgi:hypothetical protein
MEGLIAARAAWFNELDAESAAALRKAADDAIRRSAADIGERLRDEEIWLRPTVLVEERFEQGGWRWELGLFDFVRTLVSRSRPARPDPQLDNPVNRAWILLLNAADPLDGVLVEFGLRPSALPDPGGGHFGLQPRTLAQLDPTGALAELWARYGKLFRGYARLERGLSRGRRQGEGEEQGRDGVADRDEALRRWRDLG